MFLQLLIFKQIFFFFLKKFVPGYNDLELKEEYEEFGLAIFVIMYCNRPAQTIILSGCVIKLTKSTNELKCTILQVGKW